VPRILVVSNDLVQQRMAGPAIRAYELARQLAAAGLDVTLTTPGSTDLDEPSLRLVAYDDERLRALAAEHDVLVVQGWVIDHHHWLRDTAAALVVDLYDPIPLEGLVHFERKDPVFQLAVHENTLGVMNEQIRLGDFFLCASERQRDYWLGMLTALNRINPPTYAADPTLRNLMDVVPFGIPERPPQPVGPVMRGVIAGIDSSDLVLLWGGGIYDWFDPLTLVRGVARGAQHALVVARQPRTAYDKHGGAVAAEVPPVAVEGFRRGVGAGAGAKETEGTAGT